jgi:hypothetical protein
MIATTLFVALTLLPCATADGWDVFTNNLATDLAPIIGSSFCSYSAIRPADGRIALFGEQVSKQYLSESVSALDNFIFAMGPLGILTAVVSVIRVCGNSMLKAFVGRAQESRGAIEAELMSSTSHDVCELWNGDGVARVLGRPEILELVHDRNEKDYRSIYYDNITENSTGVIKNPSAAMYRFKEYSVTKGEHSAWAEHGSRRSSSEPASAFPPNLSLNLSISRQPSGVLLMIAVVSFLLQAGVLAFAGLAAYPYRQRFTKDGALMPPYAFPFTLVGTTLMCFGMFLCATLVDRSTKKAKWKKKPESKFPGSELVQMLWLRPGDQTVGDQVFDPFARKEDQQRYMTSEKNGGKSSPPMVYMAVGSTMTGFIFQFVGLRAMHAAIALAQLGVTLVMATLRASLRMKRSGLNLLREEGNKVHGHELDWLAMLIEDCDVWDVIGPKEHTKPELMQFSERPNRNEIARSVVIGGILDENTPNPLEVEVENVAYLQREQKNPSNPAAKKIREGEDKDADPMAKDVPRPNLAVRVMKTRARLARLTSLECDLPWDLETRYQARNLKIAIEGAMNVLYSDGVSLIEGWQKASAFCWPINCNIQAKVQDQKASAGDSQDPAYLSLRRSRDTGSGAMAPWKVDESELEAVLGLWLWSLKTAEDGSIPIKWGRLKQQRLITRCGLKGSRAAKMRP